jgi:hypothetical protein
VVCARPNRAARGRRGSIVCAAYSLAPIARLFLRPVAAPVSHKKARRLSPRGADTRAGLSRHLLAPPLGRPGRTTKSWDGQDAMSNSLSFSICPLLQRRSYREVNPLHCGCPDGRTSPARVRHPLACIWPMLCCVAELRPRPERERREGADLTKMTPTRHRPN